MTSKTGIVEQTVQYNMLHTVKIIGNTFRESLSNQKLSSPSKTRSQYSSSGSLLKLFVRNNIRIQSTSNHPQSVPIFKLCPIIFPDGPTTSSKWRKLKRIKTFRG